MLFPSLLALSIYFYMKLLLILELFLALANTSLATESRALGSHRVL